MVIVIRVYALARNRLLMLLCCVLVTKNKRQNKSAAFHSHRPAALLSVVVFSLLAFAAAFHSHRPAASLSVVLSLLAVAIH